MLILSPFHRWRLPAAAAFAILLLLVACKKNEPAAPVDHTITLTYASSVYPHAGDTLLFRGTNLGKDPSIFDIHLDTVALKVYRCQDTILSVIMPTSTELHYFGSRSSRLYVIVKGSMSASMSFSLSVLCPEPKGWFDAYRGTGVLNYFGIQSTNISLAFANDTIGYMHYKDGMLKTRDGGLSWQQPDFHYGNALCLSVFDTAAVWSGDIGFVNSTRDGGNSWTNHRLPAALNNLIIGQYMTSPTTGLIASGQGYIYQVSGTSFDTTSEFTPDYQSKWMGNSRVWASLSAVDVNNLILVGAGNDATVFPSVYRPLVAVKTNGVYDEYLLPSAVTEAGISQVQLVNNMLGFAIDGNNDLLKYTGNRNWTVLSQKATAVLFVDATTGYAAYNESIYKTTDGGQTWASVYSLRSGDVVINFTTRNGKLWALGNNSAQNAWFVEKYNP